MAAPWPVCGEGMIRPLHVWHVGGLGSIRQLGVRQIDPPERGYPAPRQGTRRERTPPKRGQVLSRCALSGALP
jgi:hypothetical protein